MSWDYQRTHKGSHQKTKQTWINHFIHIQDASSYVKEANWRYKPFLSTWYPTRMPTTEKQWEDEHHIPSLILDFHCCIEVYQPHRHKEVQTEVSLSAGNWPDLLPLEWIFHDIHCYTDCILVLLFWIPSYNLSIQDFRKA